MREGLRTLLDPTMAAWAAQVFQASAPVFVVSLPDGEPQAVHPSVAAVLGGELSNLYALFPEADMRRAVRDALVAGAPWHGELRPGLFVTVVPLDAGAAWVELAVRPSVLALLADRTARAERTARRSRRQARWRDAEHAVAAVVGGGASVAESAEVAVTAIESALGVRDAQVYEIDGEQLVRVAGNGAERVTLASNPAVIACARRAPAQEPVGPDATFPMIAELAAHGVRCVLHVPVAVVQAAHAAQVAEVRAALEREELGRSQERLLHAARLSSIGELAAGLVHELAQPLNVVGGYVELLQDVSTTDAGRNRALTAMGRAVDRMSTLVDNLRSFSRGGASRVATVPVHRFLTMARDLTGCALKRGVTVGCPEDLMVRGDENQLEQVVVNLVANALQAGGDPVELVAGPRSAGGAWIEVRDRGPGVPEGLRARIFEAFFTTKPPGQGTGLGLAVSARIVRDHGGTLVVGDREGGGAVFRVELPAA